MAGAKRLCASVSCEKLAETTKLVNCQSDVSSRGDRLRVCAYRLCACDQFGLLLSTRLFYICVLIVRVRLDVFGA